LAGEWTGGRWSRVEATRETARLMGRQWVSHSPLAGGSPVDEPRS
jgi:hypothetical protein